MGDEAWNSPEQAPSRLIYFSGQLPQKLALPGQLAVASLWREITCAEKTHGCEKVSPNKIQFGVNVD
jgi:hypothetical protein